LNQKLSCMSCQLVTAATQFPARDSGSLASARYVWQFKVILHVAVWHAPQGPFETLDLTWQPIFFIKCT
jgi:hypothetical protein